MKKTILILLVVLTTIISGYSQVEFEGDIDVSGIAKYSEDISSIISDDNDLISKGYADTQYEQKVSILTGSLTDDNPTEIEINAIAGLQTINGYTVLIKDSDGTGLLYRCTFYVDTWYFLVLNEASQGPL